MSESRQDSAGENQSEYLALTRKQTGSGNWTANDIARLHELEGILGINKPPTPMTEQQREALHRQGTANKKNPLTEGERALIVAANSRKK